MKRYMVALISAPLLLWGCGSDDDGGGDAQAELAELLVQDSAGVVDEECISDKTNELSDEDAEFLIDNFEATGTDGFSTELQAWAASLIDCFDLAEQE